jgi:hypothetical protein
MKANQRNQKIICFLILFSVQISFAQSQAPVFPKITGLTNAAVTPSGKLEIFASKTSSQRDFDFLTGKWTMDNKRLKTRLKNSNEWEEFVSKDENYGMMLNGIGNMDIYKATFDGKPFEGLTIRLFNPETRLWSLYWVPSTTGVMDPPVVGSFDGNIGIFYCKDVYQGTPVLVMFKWDKTDKDNPVWSQAFSPDNGVTWEWNWTNTSHRIK